MELRLTLAYVPPRASARPADRPPVSGTLYRVYSLRHYNLVQPPHSTEGESEAKSLASSPIAFPAQFVLWGRANLTNCHTSLQDEA